MVNVPTPHTQVLRTYTSRIAHSTSKAVDGALGAVAGLTLSLDAVEVQLEEGVLETQPYQDMVAIGYDEMDG